MKYSLKQAAEAAIASKDNRYRRQYLRMTLEQGIPSHRAKLTVTRSLLATLYAMWKSGEEYDPDLKEKILKNRQTSSGKPSRAPLKTHILLFYSPLKKGDTGGCYHKNRVIRGALKLDMAVSKISLRWIPGMRESIKGAVA